jgi:catechol 2,3-dioxygenase-like lactoylglutathione lyase family enzyme
MERVAVTFGSPTPAMPSRDVARSLDFYRDVLEFDVIHADGDFALLRRDTATISLWGATDESWRERLDPEKPVCSGAESFIAGTASFRLEVEGVDQLYAHCNERGFVHPNAHIGDTEWGTREFGVLDPDGNLIGLWEERR